MKMKPTPSKADRMFTILTGDERELKPGRATVN